MATKGSDAVSKFGGVRSVWPALGLALAVLTVAALIAAVYLTFFEAPREREMGEVQRIFYFHVSSAFAALIGFVICSVASLIYLLVQPKQSLSLIANITDRIAQAAGEIGVLFGIVVLITGPIWAKPAWGEYWTWEPRLVLMLLTVFLFVGYVALRAYAAGSDAARKLSAGVAVIGGPAVYLIHVAVKLWGGNHPQVVTGEGGGLEPGPMELTFAATAISVLVFAGLLVALRYSQHKTRDELSNAWLELSDIEEENS